MREGAQPSAEDRACDILVFGDTCVDLILRDGDIVPRFGQAEQLVNDYAIEMGGACCIFAAQAAKLGMKVALLGKVGADAFGQLILDTLNAAGVDTRLVEVDASLRTGLTAHLVDGHDRAMLTYGGSVSALTVQDVTDEILASARHLHYGSLYLQTGLLPAWRQILRRAKGLGMTVSLDTNWDPRGIWDEALELGLPHVDILLPNEEEALRLSDKPDLASAADWLRERVPLLAVKRAEAGAIAWQAGRAWQQSVTPAQSGGDGIGAGDSFDAGFVAGWLRGLPVATCLEMACECGRLVAGQAGGLRGQPRAADIDALRRLEAAG